MIQILAIFNMNWTQEITFKNIRKTLTQEGPISFEAKRFTKMGTVVDVAISAAGIQEHCQQIEDCINKEDDQTRFQYCPLPPVRNHWDPFSHS